jgi:hypothetical protein
MRKLATGLAMTASAVFALATPASAAAGDPTIDFTGGTVVAANGTASVEVTYTCTDTGGQFSHLFVGVKQGPRVDTDEHSGSDWAVSFYSTNWSSDAGPNALVCNGSPQVQTLVLRPQGLRAPLHTGTALVQLCLFANGSTPELDDAAFEFDYTMQPVVAVRR